MSSVAKVLVFNRFVTIFGKIYGSFSQKIVGEKELSKSVFAMLRPKRKWGEGAWPSH